LNVNRRFGGIFRLYLQGLRISQAKNQRESRRQAECLAIKGERRLKVFEKRVLRIIFESGKDEIVGGWRKLHNEELRKLYSSLNAYTLIKLRRMRWAAHVACMSGKFDAYRASVVKPERKRLLRIRGSR
jgi:hypothetical protein